MLVRIIFWLYFLSALFLSFVSYGNTACTYQEGQIDAVNLLDNCKPNGAAMTETTDAGGIAWIKERIQTIADALIWLGSLLSVGAIVVGWFLYASSMGSDEKVKKWKNAVIYGLIGLLVMMFSFRVVNAIIEFIYTANN